MTRACLLIICCAMVLPVYAQQKTNAQPEANAPESRNVDGIYDFVSETEELTKPEKQIKMRTSGEWEGVWHFCGGRFYRIIRKKTASPEVRSELESSVGSYRIQDNDLILMPQISQLFRTPLTEKMAFKFEGKKLILTQELSSSYESISEGRVITILQRRD